ncbi:adenylate/guanylate cyclase domain-containing protein [Skermania sp. ID1734]|uniref:adenylate/guanylate cyclase domain-containing protein n=1 Tax=Skermania sp. ID1734 TaxID=2597516 RepID=UPI00117EB8FC|nr:adenylate/guanylate cyclase domain-containing protein [Skermania sp. ID1734]TSE00296.1 adenylate/guanylate cyclase domain-containing protein [Skermania sp. ID1734]
MATHDQAAQVLSELEPLLLGGRSRLNRNEVAAAAGVPLERAEKLWIALGFPRAEGSEERRYTDADAEALRTARRLVEEGVISADLEVAVTRTMGQAMARLAEWQVDVVVANVLRDLPSEESTQRDADEVRRRISEVTAAVLPALESLQNYAWRRHLLAAADRYFASQDDQASEPSSRTLVVGFADMVGYTSRTRHLATDELTRLLESFESTATETITSGKGWVIKNVGDEVMFAAHEPADAARIALALQAAQSAVEDVPELRVGLAYGPVLTRFGDLYGSVVNIAARLTGVARPGTILVDDQLADALADNPELYFRHLRPVPVRGFSRLHAHVLRRKGQ